MITTGESTKFESFITMDDSNTNGGGLSYVADQPFVVRTNATSNFFHQSSGSWINHQSEILDSRKHFSVVNLFDNVYVFGGENEFAVDTADCLQFNGFKFNLHLSEPTTADLESVDWTRKQQMIQRRYKHRSIVLGQTIFHIGGNVDGNSQGPIERWIYDDLRKMFETPSRPEALTVLFLFQDVTRGSDVCHLK